MSQHGRPVRLPLGSSLPVALAGLVGVHAVLRGVLSSKAWGCSNYLGTI